MDSVKLVLEYLRECEVFYMATVDGLEPRVRPMSGVCEVEGRLCFLFSRSSALYHEIMGNRHVEISAVHPDKSWISLRRIWAWWTGRIWLSSVSMGAVYICATGMREERKS